MTTAAQTTLIHAAELLRSHAFMMREILITGALDLSPARLSYVRAANDSALTTALELRLLAKRIIPITAVSPVPTFEGK